MGNRAVVFFLLVVLVFALIVPMPGANADPIIKGCEPQANGPRLSAGMVIGNGYAHGPRCSTAVKTVEVCLDWNGVTEDGSCRRYGDYRAGDSNGVACKPGLWESQVTVTYWDGLFETEHSIVNQAALVVTTACR